MSIPNQKTIEKLRALQKYISDEPRQFNLDDWGGHVDPKLKITDDVLKEYLGISYEDGANLFYLQGWNREDGRGWSVEFEVLLGKTIPGTKEYAEVAAARIEHYILTGE